MPCDTCLAAHLELALKSIAPTVSVTLLLQLMHQERLPPLEKNMSPQVSVIFGIFTPNLR